MLGSPKILRIGQIGLIYPGRVYLLGAIQYLQRASIVLRLTEKSPLLKRFAKCNKAKRIRDVKKAAVEVSNYTDCLDIKWH